MPKRDFLPINYADMQKRGWEELDFLLITGDAYVDHPSFGIAIISRLLESKGFRVGVLPQPDWKNLDDFKRMGRPRYACLISGGNIDSLVNHYTAAKKKRSGDVYSPGGKTGLRPDRATIVYANKVREALPGVPVILGGIEASLRRFAHYDYWSDKVRRSILLDSQADLLVYGMGERAIIEIAGMFAAGKRIDEMTEVRGTMIPWFQTTADDVLILPDYLQICEQKREYAKSFWLQYQEQDAFHGKTLYEPYGQKGVLQYPPALPLTAEEMDEVYDLTYMGTYHPAYAQDGGVPAIREVKFSIVSSRGCYGGCSFCALAFHQGRIVQGRSADSIIREAKQLTQDIDFKGYIHDVGGPTANFRRPACAIQLKKGICTHRQCLYPKPCPNADLDHTEYMELLARLRHLPGIKKVFIRSGIRYDAVLADQKTDFLRELCKHHVSGQLKVAPEHISNAVLKRMGKPGKETYARFAENFERINREIGKKQYLVPYLMSSHPGSTLRDALELAEYIRDMGIQPEQVQDFIPTPGTLSSCMYYSGFDPRTMEKVYVPRSMHEKAMQRALLQYRNPRNYDLVHEALHLAHREDLIGFGLRCLIKPKAGKGKESSRKISCPAEVKTKKKENVKKEKLSAGCGRAGEKSKKNSVKDKDRTGNNQRGKNRSKGSIPSGVKSGSKSGLKQSTAKTKGRRTLQ